MSSRFVFSTPPHGVHARGRDVVSLSFVGAGRAGVAQFHTVAMSPTVAGRVEANLRACGGGTGRRGR